MKKPDLKPEEVRSNIEEAVAHPDVRLFATPRLIDEPDCPKVTAPDPERVERMYRHPAPDPETVREWLQEHADAEPEVRLEPTADADTTEIDNYLDQTIITE